ncbi:MAG TPA: hypothetical protein VLZ77_02605 [Acidimicrobiales bacterium]|nr:hypothetical protein [Acidimicrobiales bacterium]
MTLLQGHETGDGEDRHNGQTSDPEARRKLQRRLRPLAIVTLVGIIALAVIIPLVVLGPSSTSLLPEETPLNHSGLFEPAGRAGSREGGGAGNFNFAIIDPATGTTTPVRPFSSNTLVSTPFVASGNELVDVIGLKDTVGVPNVGTAVAFTPDRPQVIRSLGTASYVVDASTSNDVWLVVDPEFPYPVISDSGCTVEEVSLFGVVATSPRPFPCGWSIKGPAPRGLLVERVALSAQSCGWKCVPPARLSSWDPIDQRVIANYGYASKNLSIDADNGQIVLWNECDGPHCVDNATNLVSGRTTIVPELPKGWQRLTQYTLSPDGNFAAVIEISNRTEAALEHYARTLPRSPPCCYFGVHAIPSRLLVYNLSLDRLVEQRSFMAASYPVVEWSPDGGWLFVTEDLQHIEAVPMWSDSESVRSVPTRKRIDGEAPAESFLPFPRQGRSHPVTDPGALRVRPTATHAGEFRYHQYRGGISVEGFLANIILLTDFAFDPIQKSRRERKSVGEVGDGDSVERHFPSAWHQVPGSVSDPNLHARNLISLSTEHPAHPDELGLGHLALNLDRFESPDVPPCDPLKAPGGDLLS